MAVRLAMIVTSDTDDIFLNQAAEAQLAAKLPEGAAALFLWSNARTVVIGRNQDARAECDIALLESEGGRLARRLSGGGAVYHDSCDLNFTFLAWERDFEKDANTRAVIRALARLGVRAEATGRNDITVRGAKISGSAYHSAGGVKLHHGTLIIGSHPGAVARYLTPSPRKLAERGVASVSARVTSLGDLAGADKRAAADALRAEFAAMYPEARVAIKVFPRDADAEDLRERAEFFAGDEWRKGKSGGERLRLSAEVLGRRAEIAVGEDGGIRIYSDGLDAGGIAEVERLLAEGAEAPGDAGREARRIRELIEKESDEN